MELTENIFHAQDNITLAGESAGGVYVHAHTIVGTPVQRAILQSGSLFLSPPMQLKSGKVMIDGLSKRVQQKEGCSLEEAPTESLLRHMHESGVSSLWLQAADGLEGWQKKKEQIESLMVGDCEYDVRMPEKSSSSYLFLCLI